VNVCGTDTALQKRGHERCFHGHRATQIDAVTVGVDDPAQQTDVGPAAVLTVAIPAIARQWRRVTDVGVETGIGVVQELAFVRHAVISAVTSLVDALGRTQITPVRQRVEDTADWIDENEAMVRPGYG
jgi:hypothetical protein